ncbi:MAG: transposase [Planctomycetaceae bacterium]
MLNAYQAPVLTDQDRVVFDRLVPYDHWTRRADARIDFLALRQSIEHYFSSEGRPAVEPILCLKFELLMFHDALSDRQVFAKAKTDIAYRLFLGLGLNDHLPDVSTLRGFLSRLGVEGHKAVFHQLLSQARGHGLVKASTAACESLQKAVEIAQKALHGHDDPKASRKLRSTVDPDARRGRHGEYYDGYFTDVLIDADSELFTAIGVLPADGNETADTLNLLDKEQSAHGNVIEKISIDGAGFDGSLIRELESRRITPFVPPKEPSNGGRFTTAEFQFSEDGSHATCPAGHRSQYRQRDDARHTTSFRFAKATCDACPLMKQCISVNQKHGRSVKLNDYEPEYALLRERRQTDEYAAVKQERPKVERRLGELVNRLKGRRARYRGLCRV